MSVVRRRYRRWVTVSGACLVVVSAMGLVASTPNAAGKASVQAGTKTDSRACSVIGSMTWRNQPDSNYVSLHIFDETTGNTEVGLGSSFSGAGPSGSNTTEVAGVSGDRYYSIGSIYTAEGGQPLGTATSRTVSRNCR